MTRILALTISLGLAAFTQPAGATGPVHATAAHSSRFVYMYEWKREARREAARECLRTQSPPVVEGFRLHECVKTKNKLGHDVPDAKSGPCLRSLEGDVAFCRAEFRIYHHENGKTRVFVGIVHMHVTRRDKIAVERPVGWLPHWLGGDPT